MPRRFEKFLQALRQSIFFFSLSDFFLQRTHAHTEAINLSDWMDIKNG